MVSRQHFTTKNETIRRSIIILFTGVTTSLGMNMFLAPAHVLSAGVNGFAQIVGEVIHNLFGISIDLGILILLLNIPLLILSWVKLGKNETIFSLITIGAISFFTVLLPKVAVSSNPLMNAIVGGVLIGVGTGFCLKNGFTTGGLDIISLVVSKTTGRTVGSLMMLFNSIIVGIAGFLFSWESALYTIISIFCLTQVVDRIHTRHQKVTAFIISSKAEAVQENLKEQLIRGMTIFDTHGGYTKNKNQTIMMVVTRYELYDLEKAVFEIDPQAFVNIVGTQSLLGTFWNEQQQRDEKTTRASQKIKSPE